MSEKRNNMTISTRDGKLNNYVVLETEDVQMIKLVVKDWEGEVVPLRMKKNAQLKTLMTAYSQKKSIDITGVHFLFDSTTIKPLQTPKMLEMEDGDQIDAMLSQIGGGGLKPPSPSSKNLSCLRLA